MASGDKYLELALELLAQADKMKRMLSDELASKP